MATETAIELTESSHWDANISKTLDPVIADSSGRPLGLDPSPPGSNGEESPAAPKLSKGRSWIVITTLCGIQFISSLSNGLLTVGLPTIAAQLGIPENLLVWPNSVLFLTSGSVLLIAGSIADVLGPRRINLPGSLLVSVFLLACGFARSSTDLIAFRALQGIATAMVVPSAVSIISTNMEDGRPRNIGFASIFLAQPLGFAMGLVLGGVFIDTIGWRAAFYIGGAIGLMSTAIAVWTLPKDPALVSVRHIAERLAKEIDWVGAGIASGALAMLSYVLAMLSANTSYIKQATNIVLLVISLILFPTFGFWMRRQEIKGKPALIPNSLWKNTSFTSVCLMILLSNAVVNCMELFCSLFFQEVQLLPAIQAAIRVLPQVITGMILNFLSGVFADLDLLNKTVNKAPIMPIVLGSTVLCSISPILMATINPAQPYWYSAFWAQVLAPMSVDILFTVGTLIVSSAFPTETQALAGAVFQTFAQLGTSVGLCVMSVISASVTARSGRTGPVAVMDGYRATFWALFAWMAVAAVVGAVGLRKVGKVGVKRD